MSKLPAIARASFALGLDLGMLLTSLVFLLLIPGGFVFELLLVGLFVFLAAVNGQEVLRYRAAEAQKGRQP